MNQNTNLSEAEYRLLLVKRGDARAVRKEFATRRYHRRYSRIGGRKPERMIRVSEIVTITIGLLTTTSALDLNSLLLYPSDL